MDSKALRGKPTTLMEAQKPIDTPIERDALQEFIEETRERFRNIPIDYDERHKRELIENLRE